MPNVSPDTLKSESIVYFQLGHKVVTAASSFQAPCEERDRITPVPLPNCVALLAGEGQGADNAGAQRW
jgi:hypothetical protein